MSSWDNYKYEERKAFALEPGNYRVVIVDAEEKKSKTGKDMIVIELRPSGASFSVRDYIVAGDYFNDKISRVFDAFPEIGNGNFNLLEWIGAMGAAKLKADSEGYLKVHYYLTPEEAQRLPEFEGARPVKQTATNLVGNFEDADPDDDCPF